jgi:probable rRNA maturation factor
MIEVNLDDSLQLPDYSNDLISLIADALQTIKPGWECDVTIVLTTDEELRDLNEQYRGIDRPTDVLSFESGEINPVNNVPYLGDVVISYQRASEQAKTAGHPVLNEVKLLAVHGILHLMGYDHDSAESKSQMWALQDQILKQNGVQLNRISGDDEDE